jgi:hypothetical protein
MTQSNKFCYKKELVIFIGLFLFLAIGMHFKQWTSYPIEHIMALPDANAFKIGAIHPFVFTFIAYIILAIVRFVIKLLTKNKV